MAVTSGVRAHRAFLTVSGQRFPVIDGSAEQTATRKSSAFSATLPMSLPGALSLFAGLGENDASVSVASGGAETILVEGEIDHADFDLVARTIQVHGRCKSAKLHATKSAEKWVNKKSDEIVKDLAGRVGLSVDASSGVTAGKMWQIDWSKLTDGVSFAHVIHKLAELEGARWWVKQGTLYFKSDNDAASAYVLNYHEPQSDPVRADFLQMRIARNIQAGKSVKVTVKSWHQKKKKAFESTATIGGAGGTTVYQYHVPGLTQDHVEKHAKSKAKEHARHELSLTAECVGDASIDVAMKLRLRGTPFDQDFEMDAIHHRFGMRGHTMSISAKSAKQGRSAS